MKMRNKLKILFLVFIVIIMASLGCIESQKFPAPNETKSTTPEPLPSITEQKSPAYNETKHLQINGTFETWSRGYWSNLSYKKTYFRVITNYSDWIAFLDEQRRGKSPRLEGTLFPELGMKPKTIEPADFNDYFIIAAMMGYQTKQEPEIEIKNISRIGNTINVTVRLYNPSFGLTVESAPYHIIIVKREILQKGNSTFIFVDTEGKNLGELELNIKD